MGKKKAAGRQQALTELEPLLEELSTESTGSSRPTTQRPKTSPYTGSPIALHIGPEHREYYVPQNLLQNPGWIASCSSGDYIYLPNVDEDTGHVLVHYLYTGVYQTLDNMETSPVKEVHIEFKRAVLAYITAKTYELAGLQQLAMHKVEHYGTEMNIFDVVEALNEDFSKLPGNTHWLQDYLNGKIKTAFEEDHTTFAKDDFFGRISNVALNKVLVKRVVELYNNKLSCMLNIEKDSIQRVSEEYVPAAQDSPVEEAPAQVSVAIEEAPVEDCPVNEGPAQECSVQECPVQECSIGGSPVEEAPVQEASIDPVAAEPKIDMSFGDGGSKSPGFSFGLSSWASGWPEKPKEEEGPWSFSFGNAKDERKKKKGATLIEETPAESEPASELVLEPEPEAAKEDDAWGWGSFSTGKKKKKKGKKGVIEAIEEPKVEELPPLPPELTPLADDDWGSLVVAGKKKKGKKGAKQETLVEEPPPPPPPEPELSPGPEPEDKEDDPWDDWGTTKKKKKGKKGKEEPKAIGTPAGGEVDDSECGPCNAEAICEPDISTASPCAARAEADVTLWPLKQTEEVDMRVSNGHSDLKAESEQPVKTKGGICPVRVKHLLEGDMWRNCRQCRALLRQVAIQLASAGHANEDGYEIVDEVLMG
ncbi:uncharacterized protein BDR25DRAFT_264224 [Lindgomyces ingoldianus]|uniref:Uncharacterized protein n=1 Tax=Lindgomyces ingoldianus TaxID=673940 RepID=A0ACB6QR69_9PLEO|nr:uncharacterized protein BDR25DRAFT_264224 [Lindgomyces ingoldianus]KAF2469058.1 hypothetical protein BDR25DRAFT_264224 [Lindgomyces ingoldianus]